MSNAAHAEEGPGRDGGILCAGLEAGTPQASAQTCALATAHHPWASQGTALPANSQECFRERTGGTGSHSDSHKFKEKPRLSPQLGR